MSVRGVPQLRSLVLSYCLSSGSSAGVRDFIRSGAVAAEENNVFISLVKKSNHHPQLTARYLNGRVRRVCLRAASVGEVAQQLRWLRQSTGRFAAPRMWPLPATRQPSIQGGWDESFSYRPLTEQIQQAINKDKEIIGVAGKIKQN